MSQATQNELALDLYLRARYHEDSEWEVDSSDRAIAFYEQAIELDPKFAQAWIGLARTLWVHPQIADREPRTLLTRAAESLRRALELSPGSAEGHALLGRISADLFELAAAEEHIRRAEQLGANTPIALEQLSQYYSYFGWPPEKGLHYAQRWAVIDPLNLWAHSNAAVALFHTYDHDQAIAAIDPVVARNPEWWVAHFVRTGPLMDLGLTSDALASARRAVELHPSVDTRADLAITYARAGDLETARALLKQLDDQRADRHFPSTTRALVALALGDNEGAILALEAAYDERDRYLIPILHEQRLIPLHEDPRFKRLVELLGQERRIAYLVEKVSPRRQSAAQGDQPG
jgi:serine/threonine-protein kinase